MLRLALGALLVVGAFVVPVTFTAATAATLSGSEGRTTNFGIDGNKSPSGTPTDTIDWDSILTNPNGPPGSIDPNGNMTFTPPGEYFTSQGNRSTGILDATFSWDNGAASLACDPQAQDRSGSPGSQTPNTNPSAPGSANVNKKDNLCSAGAAWEVVYDSVGVRHAIYYSYVTRLADNGDMDLAQLLEGPLPGRCDDVLVVFDYNSGGPSVTPSFRQWQPTNGVSCTTNPNGPGQWVPMSTPGQINFDWAAGDRRTDELGPIPNPNNHSTFIEFAIDLTTAGLFTPDKCATFAASTTFTRTGNDFTAQNEDYLTPANPLVLSNCGSLRVTKEVVPAAAANANDHFDYLVNRAANDGIVLPENNDATEIRDSVDGAGPGSSDFFSNVLAADDYRLTELLQADSSWANQSIVCTTTEPGTGETLTYRLKGADADSDVFRVYPDTTTNCVITNTTSTVTVIKKTLPSGSPQAFPFKVGTNDATLRDGGTPATFSYAPGTPVTISETPQPGWMPDADISCVGPDGPIGTATKGTSVEVTTVAAGNITCTFTNTQLSTIRIGKEALGTPDNTPFAFSGTWTTGQLFTGPGAYNPAADPAETEAATVTGMGTSTDLEINTTADETFYYATFTDVTPGHYSVAEAAGQAGTLLAGIRCIIGGQIVRMTGYTADFDLAPGDTVSCFYVNATPGRIVVAKLSDPPLYDQAFDFTFQRPDGTPTEPFKLTPTPGNATRGFDTLPAGQYVVTETSDLPNWTLKDVVCSSALHPESNPATVNGPVATVTLDSNDVVSCAFTNTADPASIELTKTVTGVAADYPWSFDFDVINANTNQVDATLTVSSAKPTADPAELVPGVAYRLVEKSKTGWIFRDLTCTIGELDAFASSFTLKPGEQIVCEANNEAKPASLTLTKTVTGVADSYPWSFDFQLTPAGGTATTKTISGTGPSSDTATWNSLTPGAEYTVSEVVPAGWDAGALLCTGVTDLDGDPSNASVTFVAGLDAQISCAIDNDAQPGQISITKTAIGGDDTFVFLLTPLGPPIGQATPITVETTGGTGTNGLGDLTAGLRYSVEEAVDLHPDWEPTGPLACSATHANDFVEDLTIDDFTVEPGDLISCTAENSKLGTITVHKATTLGTDGTFDFTLTGNEDFSLTTVDGAASTADLDPRPGLNQRPGSYTVTEVLDPAGDVAFDFDSVSCFKVTATGPEAVGTDDGQSATFDLAYGDAVDCYFINAERSQIIVQKVTDPAAAPDEFTFTGSWLPGLDNFTASTAVPFPSKLLRANQPYTITENENLMPGWNFTSVTCVNGDGEEVGDADGSSVTVTPAVGDVVVCTYTNTKQGTIRIDKQGSPSDDASTPFQFAITPAGQTTPIATDTLTIAGTDTRSGFSEAHPVKPGDYTISELAIPAEWEFSTITCTVPGPVGADPIPVAITATRRDQTGRDVDAALHVGPGQDVSCIATNVKHGPVSITKTTPAMASPTATPGVYEVIYTVTATTQSYLPEQITVTDSFAFSAGLTRGATTVIGPSFPPGGGAFPETDGVLYKGFIQPDEPPMQWFITTLVTVDPASSSTMRTCAGGVQAGSGAWNGVVLAVDGEDVDHDEACASVPSPNVSVLKEAPTVSDPDASGAMTATYRITVTNSGEGQGLYALSDTPAFPSWVTIQSIAVNDRPAVSSPTFPFTLTPSTTIDGATPSGATTHTYTVTIAFTMSPTTSGEGATCVPSTPAHGLFNTANLTWNGGTGASSSCGDIPRSTLLTISKTASGTQFQPGDQFTYEILVRNTSVSSAASPVSLSDPIPSNLRVTGVTTSTTATPRWNGCSVSAADAGGYGGTLGCDLSDPLAPGAAAPVVTVSVTVRADDAGGTVRNTATVHWALDGDPSATGSAQDTVDVQIAAPKAVVTLKLADTGAAKVREFAIGGVGLVLLGMLLLATRRRRSDG